MVVAIYDSDLYIKRLNDIEIDKNPHALGWTVNLQFSESIGCLIHLPDLL